MLNWLEIYCYLILPVVIASIILSVYRFKKTNDDNDNIANASAMVALFVGIFGFMACVMPGSCMDSYWGGKWTHEDSKLISLSNNDTISGNLTRGTGNIQGDVACSFALEWPDGTVTIQASSTQHVIFHPNDDGIVKVLQWHSIEYYPRSIADKEREHGCKYHIWIPRDKMNYYIKFN